MREVLSQSDAGCPTYRAAHLRLVDECKKVRQGMRTLRFGPMLALPIRVLTLSYGHKVVIHRKRRFRGHEIHISGPPGADYGNTKIHGLSKAKSEPLCPMQRHEAVAATDQVLDFIVMHLALDEADPALSALQVFLT